LDNAEETQQDNSQSANIDSELQPIKILYIFKKLDELNQKLIQNNKDNTDIQFFLKYMPNLSYDTILTIIPNLLNKYEVQLKTQGEIHDNNQSRSGI